jgi:hypothetical protein
MHKTRFIIGLLGLILIMGCQTTHQVNHKVEPIKIEITVKIQVEKDLDNFFSDIDDTATPENIDAGSTPS